MKRYVVLSICLLVCTSFTLTQQTPQPQVSQGAPTVSQSADRIQVEETIQRYLAAYSHRSLPELLAVWPDLQNQKKDYEKIKRHLADPGVSDEKVTVQPSEIRSTNDGALVRAERTEQFVKTETTSTIGVGDLRAGGMPGQDPGPYQSQKKKDVKKSGEVWITMHRAGDAWTIVSLSDKKPN